MCLALSQQLAAQLRCLCLKESDNGGANQCNGLHCAHGVMPDSWLTKASWKAGAQPVTKGCAACCCDDCTVSWSVFWFWMWRCWLSLMVTWMMQPVCVKCIVGWSGVQQQISQQARAGCAPPVGPCASACMPETCSMHAGALTQRAVPFR